jgi:hypothetical protein
VQIRNPEIFLRRGPDCEKYLKLNLGDFDIENFKYASCNAEISADQNRIMAGFDPQRLAELNLTSPECVIISSYRIKIHNAFINRERKFNSQTWSKEIAENFDLTLTYSSTLMSDELKVLFPSTNLQTAYDNSNRIKIDISPLVVIFGNLEYNEIMNANFYNLGFDDQMDSLFTETFGQKEEIFLTSQPENFNNDAAGLVEVGTR